MSACRGWTDYAGVWRHNRADLRGVVRTSTAQPAQPATAARVPARKQSIQRTRTGALFMRWLYQRSRLNPLDPALPLDSNG